MAVKKILMVTPVMDIGGAEKVARDIALEAPGEQFAFHYLILKDKVGKYEEQLLEHGCKSFHVPEPSESYVNYVKNLLRIMRQERYDAVHAHTMFSIGWVMLAAKLRRIPVRVSHAHSALDNGDGLVKRVYEAVMRLLINSCATELVACGVAAGQRLYGKRAYDRRGLLVRNGIDTGAFRYDDSKGQAIRREWGFADRFVIGHAGHLLDVKNQSFLIDLMPKILEKKPDALLLLLGDGPDRAMLEEKITQKQLHHCVKLTGNVSNVGDFLSAMDVFAFPSLYEGMPLALLEVQANGLPCVLSDRVPEDVVLTDLMTRLPLEAPERWLEPICSAKRQDAQGYADVLKDKGLDVHSALEKIYAIYEKE